MTDWQPIETAEIRPFDAGRWYMPASPSLLLVNATGRIVIGDYSYTKAGKGRWKDNTFRGFEPTHWMPLPDPPRP